jgi:hypothetical protein
MRTRALVPFWRLALTLLDGGAAALPGARGVGVDPERMFTVPQAPGHVVYLWRVPPR